MPAFVQRVEQAGGSLPSFVTGELSAFVTCGDFRHGFVLARCRHCAEELRVPFSCKGRGVCPSCIGRRMAEGAALMVDHRLPAVPYRQWVLSFEGSMAVRLGYDSNLLRRVCQRFAHRIMAALRRHTKRAHDLASVEPLHPGLVIVVQRFRYDLGLYVHLHALVTDGCFTQPADGTDVRFLPAAGLDTAALSDVLSALHRDLADDSDEPPAVDDALAACVQVGLSGSGPVVSDEQPPASRPMTVCRFGMQLHAASTVDGRDRKRLERVCRYLLRPPFAHDAIEALPDGRVRIHFSRPTRVGARFTTITRDTFLARLAALVPPPRFNTVRYYGVLAGRHHFRPLVQPKLEPLDPQHHQLPLFIVHRDAELPALTTTPPTERAPSRIAWASLLARVFSIFHRLPDGRGRGSRARTIPRLEADPGASQGPPFVRLRVSSSLVDVRQSATPTRLWEQVDQVCEA